MNPLTEGPAQFSAPPLILLPIPLMETDGLSLELDDTNSAEPLPAPGECGV